MSRTRKALIDKRRKSRRVRSGGMNANAPEFIPSNLTQSKSKVNWGIKKPLLLNTSVPQNIEVPKHVRNVWHPELNMPSKANWNIKYPVLGVDSKYMRMPKKVKNIWK